MPTVLRVGGLRVFFYSNEGQEPPHVHVVRGGCRAKFWLRPFLLAESRGCAEHEIRRIATIVRDRRALLLEAWHGYFIE